MTGSRVRVMIAVALAGLSTARADEKLRDFSRYQAIIDRSPFGAAAGGPTEVVQGSFAARYSFVGLASDKDGKIVAAVEDKEINPRRTYFVSEGDTFNGIKVVRINWDPARRDPSRLMLQSGLETATLVFEPRSGGSGAAPTPPPGIAPPTGGPPIPPPGARRTPFLRRVIENE